MNPMTKETLAALLNGRQYCEEITKPEEDDARAAGLIVIFGYSDDNIELRGAIHDEINAGDSTTLYIHRDGVLTDPEEEPCDRCSERIKRAQPKCHAINCFWDKDGYSWLIDPASADLAYAPFDIMEDGEKFCRGIVIERGSLNPNPIQDL